MWRYHRCGGAVWVRYIWNGHTWGAELRRQDDDGAPLISHCPKCGEFITDDDLTEDPPGSDIDGAKAQEGKASQ